MTSIPLTPPNKGVKIKIKGVNFSILFNIIPKDHVGAYNFFCYMICSVLARKSPLLLLSTKLQSVKKVLVHRYIHGSHLMKKARLVKTKTSRCTLGCLLKLT